MKRNISIWLALSIVVTLVVFSLVFVKAASVNQTDVQAYSGKSFDDAEVGASVPPEYKYDPIESIYVRDDGKDPHLLEGGSAKMTKVSDKLYQYTFKDLTPNKKYKFHFCVNDNFYDQFARGSDTTDYGFDRATPVFRYPPGFTPPSIELNLVEPNITVPPDGYSYDATVSLDLKYYDEEDPGNVNGYGEYTITLERKYRIKDETDWKLRVYNDILRFIESDNNK